MVSAGAPTSGRPLSPEASGEGCQCDADVLPAEACQPKQAAAPVAPAAEKVTFSADMLFNFDKSTLKDEGKAVLDDLVSRLAGVNVEVILSTGYATVSARTPTTKSSPLLVLNPSRPTSSPRAWTPT